MRDDSASPPGSDHSSQSIDPRLLQSDLNPQEPEPLHFQSLSPPIYLPPPPQYFRYAEIQEDSQQDDTTLFDEFLQAEVSQVIRDDGSAGLEYFDGFMFR